MKFKFGSFSDFSSFTTFIKKKMTKKKIISINRIKTSQENALSTFWSICTIWTLDLSAYYVYFAQSASLEINVKRSLKNKNV